LGAVGNDSNPAGLAAPVGWTEQADVGQGNPPVGLETVTRDSGFTGTTITWGGTSASAFASIIVELDTAPVLEEEDTFWGTFNRNVVVGIAATVLTSSILTASIGQSLANSDQSDLEEFSPPSTIVEDDYWQNSVLPKDRTLYRNLPYLPDADDVPAGSLKNAPGTTDDYWQVVQAQLPYKRYLFNEKEDGIVPQPSPGNPPEDYWGTPGTVTPPDLYPEVLFLPFPLGSYGSDATTGAPPNFVEDYVQVVQDIHGYHLLPYVVGGSEETRFPLFGILDEEFDWSRFFGPPRPVEASLYQRLPYLPDPEELVIEAPAAGGLDDEYWVNPVSPVVAGNFLVLPYLPDFEESSSGFLHGALVEDYWVNPVKPTAATMFVLHPHVPDKEEPDWIFLVTDEDYWISPVPLLIQPNKNGPIYFYDQGEIALFVALAEEDYWLVLVAPQAPTIYQRLPYLPEPEQVWVIAGRIKVGAISALPLVTMDVSATPVVEMDVKKHP
ncbi:MAG: hypothetical protein Q8P12_07310, partial [bacterium]|nr:hypothetical protein [bacterium]